MWKFDYATVVDSKELFDLIFFYTYREKVTRQKKNKKKIKQKGKT